jgi:exosortase H (IPTLxxWG-CTERM-specific)
VSSGHSVLVRFAAVFAACFLLGVAILLIPPVHDLVTRFSTLLVFLSHDLIRFCGGSSVVQGPVLRAPANGFAIEMMDGCNAVNVTLLLWSAVIAFPAGWRRKLVGIVAGGVVLQGLNLIRFISLFYLGQFNKSWFDFAHVYLWESLLVLDAMVFYWIWLGRAGRPGTVTDAAR